MPEKNSSKHFIGNQILLKFKFHADRYFFVIHLSISICIFAYLSLVMLCWPFDKTGSLKMGNFKIQSVKKSDHFQCPLVGGVVDLDGRIKNQDQFHPVGMQLLLHPFTKSGICLQNSDG